MPIPLAIMPPFMAYQSLVMGDAFGKGFQYGKRKISAMSNEEFNKMTPSKLMEESQLEYTRMIPTVEKAMASSKDLQVFIVQEMLRVLPELGKKFVEQLTDIGGSIAPEQTVEGGGFRTRAGAIPNKEEAEIQELIQKIAEKQKVVDTRVADFKKLKAQYPNGVPGSAGRDVQRALTEVRLAQEHLDAYNANKTFNTRSETFQKTFPQSQSSTRGFTIPQSSGGLPLVDKYVATLQQQQAQQNALGYEAIAQNLGIIRTPSAISTAEKQRRKRQEQQRRSGRR